MRLGIPGGLLFYTYEPFIRTFFSELGAETEYSTESSREILRLGRENCVDEACLPIKIFIGHVMKLLETCDSVVVPRLVSCEKNQSICPKFDGLPELVKSGTGKSNFSFTEPFRLYDERSMLRNLTLEVKRLGLKSGAVKKAFYEGLKNQRNTTLGLKEWNYTYKVFLSGHPYHVYDKFANRSIIEKLHTLDIGVITEEWVGGLEKKKQMEGLIKNPYWIFFINNYGAAKKFVSEKSIDGILALSSFCCGTDAFTLEMIKNDVGDETPFMVLKLDEQSGNAGIETRLEAFQEILKRRRLSQDYEIQHIKKPFNENFMKENLLYEDDIPAFGKPPHVDETVFQ